MGYGIAGAQGANQSARHTHAKGLCAVLGIFKLHRHIFFYFFGFKCAHPERIGDVLFRFVVKGRIKRDSIIYKISILKA